MVKPLKKNPETPSQAPDSELSPITPAELHKEQEAARQSLGFKPFDQKEHKRNLLEQADEEAKKQARDAELAALEAELAVDEGKEMNEDPEVLLKKSLLAATEIDSAISSKREFIVQTNEIISGGEKLSARAVISRIFEAPSSEHDTLAEISERLQSKKSTPDNVFFQVDVDLGQREASGVVRTINLSLPLLAFVDGTLASRLTLEIRKLSDLVLFAYEDHKRKTQVDAADEIEKPTEDVAKPVTMDKKPDSKQEKTLRTADFAAFGQNKRISQINPRSESSVRLPVAFAVNNGDVWGVADLDHLEAKPVELGDEKAE